MTHSHLAHGTGLDVAGVLSRCASNWIPVNVDTDIAIEAHRRAPGPHTLRAVVLARAATANDLQKQLDYLQGLTDDAWQGYDPGPRKPGHDLRDATLRTIARCIAWRSLG